MCLTTYKHIMHLTLGILNGASHAYFLSKKYKDLGLFSLAIKEILVLLAYTTLVNQICFQQFFCSCLNFKHFEISGVQSESV